MSAGARIEELEANARFYRDRVSLLRARLYRRGTGTSPRLEELERGLELAEQRLRNERRRQRPLPGAH